VKLCLAISGAGELLTRKVLLINFGLSCQESTFLIVVKPSCIILSNASSLLPTNINMKKSILLFAALVFLTIQNHAQTVTDIDGNVYNTVTIGTQVWMVENLKVTHYRNGDLIPNIKDDSVWSSLCDPYYFSGTGARCYWNDDSVSYASVYGAMYNYYVISDSRNIAPVGWHVPDLGDWYILHDYLGPDNEGGKLKESGIDHWQSPNTGATNETGFTALPGSYSGIGQRCSLWSTTSASTHWPWRWAPYLEYNSGLLVLNSALDECVGNYIRLVNDTLFTGLKDMNRPDHIHLYPVPATDKVVLEFPVRQIVHLAVYDLLGNIVIQTELSGMQEELDIKDLSKGIYVIQVTGSDWTTQKKMIKE